MQLLKELLLLILGQEAGLGRFDVLEDTHTQKKNRIMYIKREGTSLDCTVNTAVLSLNIGLKVRGTGELIQL